MAELATLPDLIARLAPRGESLAVLALAKDKHARWTYRELAGQVQRLACGLVENGLARGDRVAIQAANRPEWIVACLAIVQAGGVVVAIDAQLRGETLEHVIRDSDPRLIFCSRDVLGVLEKAGLIQGRKYRLLDAAAEDSHSWQQLLRESNAAFPAVPPEDPAVLFYTSGTTGKPKGVPLSHKNLVFQLNSIVNIRLVTERDRLLLPLPLHHVYPFVIGMLTPLALGLSLVFPQSLTGPQLVRALKEANITVLIGVPRLYRALCEAIETRAKAHGPTVTALLTASQTLSHWCRRLGWRSAGKLWLRSLHKHLGPKLRLLASGGSALAPELARQLEDLGWQVAIGYGLTETSPLLTINLPGQAPKTSVGQPLPGVQIRLDTTAAPADTVGTGEIQAQGPGVFHGYWDLPDRTRDIFTDDGWFRTGDLGYRDDQGNLYVQGRASTLIVTESGKNIQPDEVEEAYASHPDIQEIAILQQNNKLVAVVRPDFQSLQRRGETADVMEAIRDAIGTQAQKLPSYQRVTDFAITREPLERTRLGKLRRHLLAERFEQAKNGRDGQADRRRGPQPLSEMSADDQTLLHKPAARQIWNWLAQRYRDRPLTPDTSPQLDLGIDSMEWLNLTLEIRQRVGVEIAEETIPQLETVRDLLRAVTEQKQQGGEVSKEIAWDNPEELLSAEQLHWLRPLHPFQHLVGWLLYKLNGLLLRLFFRLQIEGRENLPAQGPYIVAPNHLSTLDAPSVAAALGYTRLKNTYWAAWTGAVFRNPIQGMFARIAHIMPIARAQGVLSSLAAGAVILKRGYTLVWFPEGTRSRSGELQPFKSGIGLLLKEYQVPVVPVYLSGVHEAWPLGRAFPRPHRIKVVIGKPLEVGSLEQQGEGELPQDRIASALHDHMAQLAAQVEGHSQASSAG